MTNVGGCSEIFANDDNALVVSPGDPLELASGLESLVTRDELRLALGARGRRWVEDHASLEEYVGVIERGLLGANAGVVAAA